MDRHMPSTVAGFRRFLGLLTDAARPVARASCEGHSRGKSSPPNLVAYNREGSGGWRQALREGWRERGHQERSGEDRWTAFGAGDLGLWRGCP